MESLFFMIYKTVKETEELLFPVYGDQATRNHIIHCFKSHNGSNARHPDLFMKLLFNRLAVD